MANETTGFFDTFKPKKTSHTRFQDTPARKQRKLSKVLTRKEFNAALKKLNWFAIQPWISKIYSLYKVNEDFRIAMNKYLLPELEGKDGETANDILIDFVSTCYENGFNFIIMVIARIRMGKSRAARKINKLFLESNKMNTLYYFDIKEIGNLYFSKKKEFKATNMDLTGFKLELDDLAGLDSSVKVPFSGKEENPYSNSFMTMSFSETDFCMRNIVRPREGNCIIQDEMPSDQGKGSRNLKKALTNAIKIASGKKQINFIFINPFLVYMPNIDYYILILAVNKKEHLTLAMLCFVNDVDGKGKKMEFEGVLILNVDEPPELTDKYEDYSDDMKEGFMDGKSTVKSFDFEFILEEFLEYIEESGQSFNSKKSLEVFGRKEGSPIENRQGMDFDDIIVEVWNQINPRYNNGKSKSDITQPNTVISYQVPLGERFNPDIETVMKEYPIGNDIDEKGRNIDQRNVEIYLAKILGKTKDGMMIESQDDLADYFGLDQSMISKLVGKKGTITAWAYHAIGYCYEDWKKRKIEDSNKDNDNFIKCENPGKQGQDNPDLVVWFKDHVEVYSLKCYKIGFNRKEKRIYQDDYQAEIDYCLKLKEEKPDLLVKGIFNMYERNRHKSYEEEIRFTRPKKSKTIKLNE